MNNSQQIEADARKFAAQFSGFMEMCKLLGQTGSMEQHYNETKVRLDNASAAEAKIVARRKADHEAADAALAEKHRVAIEEHNKHCAALISDAQSKVEDLLTDAHARAAVLEARVRGHADTLALHQRNIDQAKAELGRLGSDLVFHKTALSDVQTQVEAESEKLAKIKAAQADAVAAVKVLVGQR